jgi:hypothetical protein
MKKLAPLDSDDERHLIVIHEFLEGDSPVLHGDICNRIMSKYGWSLAQVEAVIRDLVASGRIQHPSPGEHN